MASTRSAMFFIALILIQYNGSYADCNENEHSYQKQMKGFWNSLKETVSEASENEMIVNGIKTAAVGTAVATAAIAAAPVVIGAAGFGAAGVTAGSAAAAVQSVWFGGAISGVTGTVFSSLTSMGAAGLGIGAKVLVGTASGAAVKAYELFSDASEENE